MLSDLVVKGPAAGKKRTVNNGKAVSFSLPRPESVTFNDSHCGNVSHHTSD